MGNETATFIKRKAIPATAQTDGVDGLFGKVCPARAHRHSAKQSAVFAVHGLGNHIDQHVTRGGLHHAIAQGHILAADYLADVISVGPVAAGNICHIGVYPGYYTSLEVKKQKRPVPRQRFYIAAQQFLRFLRLSGKSIKHRFLAGQNSGHIYGLIDVYLCRARHDLADFIQSLCLHTCYHAIRRGGHIENKHGNHGNGGSRDGKCANAFDTELAHENTPEGG